MGHANAAFATIGFAAFLGMNSFSMWGIRPASPGAFHPTDSDFWALAFLAACLVGFLLFALDARRHTHLLQPIPRTLAVCFLGISLCLLVVMQFFSPSLIVAFSALMMGFGTTCCFLCWENILCALPEKSCHWALVLGSMLSTLPALAISAMPSYLLLLPLGLTMALNVVTIVLCTRKSVFSKNTERQEESTIKLRTMLKPIVCIMIVGAISPMLSSFAESFPGSSSWEIALVVLGNCTAALTLAVIWRFHNPSFGITQAFTIIAPFLITTIIFFPFLMPQYRIIIRFFSTFAFSLVSIVMMTYCIHLQHSYSITLNGVYSVLAGVTYASQLFAETVSGIIKAAIPYQQMLIYINTAVLLAACLITVLILYKATARQGQTDQQSEDKISQSCEMLTRRYHLTE